MKKLLLLFFSFVIYLHAVDFSQKEKHYIKHTVIKIGMLPDFFPFSFTNEGTQKGFSKDILEIFEQKHNLKFEYVIAPWPKLLQLFHSKQIDMIDTISYNEKRILYTHFTKPYYEVPLYIFSNNQFLKYESIQDLKGKKLGITKNIFYKDSITNLNLFDIKEYKSAQESLDALAKGDVELIFGHELSTQSKIIKSGYTHLKSVGELNLPQIKATDLRFGITRNNNVLFSIMSKAFDDIDESTWNQLNNKWMSVNSNKPLGIDLNIKLTKEEKAYIAQKQIIKVQNEKNWPPYNFNDGQPKGFSIDYTNLIAQKVGLKVEYITDLSWDEYVELLRENKLDVINNISKNKQREAFIDFTNIFHTASNAIYVKKGAENLDSLAKLEGKTIVMPKGFFAQQFIEKYYPNIKQVLVKDSLEALRQLSLGRADATIGKKNVLDYIISTNNISGVVPSNFVDDNRMVSLIRMGVPKGETLLRDILQKAQNAVSDEELLNLKRKWFGIKVQSPNDNRYLNKKEYDFLREKHVLNVCLGPNIEPIEFSNENGKPSGMSIDVLNLIKDDLGITYNYIQTTSQNEAVQYLKEKQCDLIPTVQDRGNTTDNIQLTYPFLSYKLAIITKKDLPVISSLENIIEKPIALKKGSVLINELKSNYPNIKIVETSNEQKALEAVNNNKADYTLLPLPIASYNMSKYAMNSLYISRYTNLSYNVHMALNSDEPLLLSALNKAIKNITEDNKRELEKRWSSIAIQERIDYSLVWKIIIFILCVIGVILYRQSILKRHNDALKQANKEIAELSSTLEARVEEEVLKNRQQTNQLIYQSRLAQMGELINMIAHQWRQPLTAISATTNSLQFQLHLNSELNKEEVDKELHLISEYSQHLSNTIDDFRNFYKKDKNKEQLTFKDVSQKALNIVQFSFHENHIDIEKIYEDETAFVSFASEINQVILNLLKNAEEILVDKQIEKPKVVIHTYSCENYICLTIKDNGGGIPQKDLANIFTSNFSTKTNKGGSGLGLYMSKIIIEEHCKGTLSATNEEDGATFKIEIPKEKNECN